MKKRPAYKRPDLKAFRDRHKLTQQDIADGVGVDIATVWRWENWGLPSRGLALKALDRFFMARAKKKPRRQAEPAHQ